LVGLDAVSPIDGRYQNKTKELSKYFSENALMKKRLLVEILFLKAMGKGDFAKAHDGFDITEAEKVKGIETRTNHDLKAIEYYLRDLVPEEVKEHVHLGLTSEDINNISYSLLLKGFLDEIYYRKLQDMLDVLSDLSRLHKDVPMLARTHGQPASPTTVGKEFHVFYSRLNRQIAILKKIKLAGKLNGATGNYNALHLVFPEKDWVAFSKEFISGLGLEPNIITTQVEPKDTLVELFQCIKRIDNILLDLDRDMWMYISFGLFRLKRIDAEVGSSTMPHKINPIDFENSEGNIKIANALFTAFEDLQVSRMQRDLSDSTVMRNIGVACGHSLLAMSSTEKGLRKIEPDADALDKDLESHPEVLTEAIQVFLKSRGIKDGYELLKDFSRGETFTMDRLHKFIETLHLDEDDKKLLKDLKPRDYVGLSSDLVSLR
jgi:adenylosuccinate lyase